MYEIRLYHSPLWGQSLTLVRISHIFLAQLTSLDLPHILIPCDVSYARKTIRHLHRTKASLHLDSSGNSTRMFAASWAFNRRCPFSFLTPLRGRVISAPVSLFFPTGARPSERSTYRRKNPLSSPFNRGSFYLCRLSSFSDDLRMNSCLYTIHLSCQQRKTSPPSHFV